VRPVPAGSERWLAEPDHPGLRTPAAARVDDDDRPDRLAWNTFRTLAAWNTDVWVPALLEVALAEHSRLPSLSWADASVDVWGSGRDPGDASTDVVVAGPEAVVLVEATFATDLTVEHLAEGAEHALALPGRAGRPAAFVLLTPSVDQAEADRLADTLAADLLDLPPGGGRGLTEEAVERVTGWLTWADVAALALDLAEEADPVRAELVHLLVTELQQRFPGLEV
jgi:hypothetical protein